VEEVVPENQQLAPYTSHGLTLREAELVHRWIEDGKPGIARYKAENLGHLYVMGYSCEDINRWFPEYPLVILLWARVQYKWDDSRDRYQRVMQGRALEAALNAQSESVRLVADIVSATNQKWRRELMDYLADPAKAKAPEYLPKTLHQFQSMLDMLSNIVTPGQDDGKKPGLGVPTAPLVSINVSSGKADPQEVAATMIAEMKKGT
jgi:hypothetical protein